MEEKSTLNYLHEYTCKVLHAKGLALHLVKKSSLYQNQVSNFLLHHPNATPTQVEVFLDNLLVKLFRCDCRFSDTCYYCEARDLFVLEKWGMEQSHKVTQYYEAMRKMQAPLRNHTKKTHLSRCTI